MSPEPSSPIVRIFAYEVAGVTNADLTAHRLEAIRNRSEAICPQGLCGFVARPPEAIEGCLKQPTNTCRTLLPPCDPLSDARA